MSHCFKVDVKMHSPGTLRKAEDIAISGEQGKIGLAWFLSQTSSHIHTHKHII